MKRFISFASVLLLASAPLFAAAGNKPQTVIIPENVAVGSTKLPAGSYKLIYSGTGTDVQVTLTQAGKTVATFAAKAVDKKTDNPGVGIYSDAGVANLQAIFLEKVSLEIVGAPHPGQ
jgi:hypothetical protein